MRFSAVNERFVVFTEGIARLANILWRWWMWMGKVGEGSTSAVRRTPEDLDEVRVPRLARSLMR